MKQSVSSIKRGILRERHATDVRNAFKSAHCEESPLCVAAARISGSIQVWESKRIDLGRYDKIVKPCDKRETRGEISSRNMLPSMTSNRWRILLRAFNARNDCMLHPPPSEPPTDITFAMFPVATNCAAKALKLYRFDWKITYLLNAFSQHVRHRKNERTS